LFTIFYIHLISYTQISEIVSLIGFAKEFVGVGSHAHLGTKLEGIQGNAGTQFHDEYEEAKSRIEKFALPFKTLEETHRKQ